ESARFRDWVTADSAARFPAERGRYHLYVSLACPWAHRTLIMRELKQLTDSIGVSVVSPIMLEHGWTFARDEGSSGDLLADRQFMHQVYTSAAPDYTGRVTVPVLWDTRHGTIVSNESADILRMLNSAFNAIAGNHTDYYPEALRGAIDNWNGRIYPAVNNGVYRAGFATTQAAYEEAYDEVFAELDHIDDHLATHRYLAGDALTEADIRLFTTLIRFDAVYHGHFKCNRQRLAEYRHIPGYVRDIYQQPGVAGTVNIDHIKTHYYASHTMINPTGVVPRGPATDFTAPHHRESIGR
ncbi:MAG: glutathione S-transferase family protein, partial [Chromatocurvus sp.]